LLELDDVCGSMLRLPRLRGADAGAGSFNPRNDGPLMWGESIWAESVREESMLDESMTGKLEGVTRASSGRDVKLRDDGLCGCAEGAGILSEEP
jgi:hypothetical protein